MPAAEFELGDIIQSTNSHSVARSPTWIARRTRLFVSTLNMRTVWWSYCEKPSAVTIVVFRTRWRASRSLGYASASAWNSASATTIFPTLPTFCL